MPQLETRDLGSPAKWLRLDFTWTLLQLDNLIKTYLSQQLSNNWIFHASLRLWPGEGRVSLQAFWVFANIKYQCQLGPEWNCCPALKLCLVFDFCLQQTSGYSSDLTPNFIIFRFTLKLILRDKSLTILWNIWPPILDESKSVILKICFDFLRFCFPWSHARRQIADIQPKQNPVRTQFFFQFDPLS